MSRELTELLRVVTVRRRRGRRDLLWFGSRIGNLDGDLVTDELAATLYEWAYVRGGPAPKEPRHPIAADRRWASATADPALHALLSGWRPHSSSTVKREGEPLIQPDASSKTRESGTLTLPALSREAIPGWLLVRHGDLHRVPNACRLYVNSDPEEVLSRLPALSRTLLDAFPNGFSAKFLASHNHRERADSTVIYLPRVPEPKLLKRIVEAFAPTVFRATVPMFTQPVAPGIAIAISPPGGQSFGMETSAGIASSLVAMLRAGRESGTRVAVPASPLSNTGAESTSHAVRECNQAPAADPLEGLLRLTRRISSEALTADGQAQWLIRRRSNEFTTMGADVYTGLAGPLLVLAHAVALTGDRDALPLLHATARSMLVRQPDLPWSGFHAGQAGVVAALAEAAAIASDTGLAEFARRALDQALTAVKHGNAGWDVIGGIGGTMIALAAAGTLLGADTRELLNVFRVRLAKSFRPDARSGGARWPGPRPQARALAGLAHGGTGAALALLVGAEPRDDDWAFDLAVRSVTFEDRARSDGTDWLDHRMHPASSPATAWCHGSAGIAIGTVAIAEQLTTSAEHRAWSNDLETRIARASERTARALQSAEFDDGLCHGASGRAMALLVAARSLRQPVDGREILARLSALPRKPDVRDLSLMNGDSGRAIAALALAGQAAPPLAVSLVPVLRRDDQDGDTSDNQDRTDAGPRHGARA